MSLPVYEALSFQKVMDGGRNKPLLILVNQDGAVKPYVLKLFPQNHNDIREAICKEVLGNILAPEFGLCTPKAALIETNVDFEMTINDPNAHNDYLFSDQRIKFATALVFPFSEFTKGAFDILQMKQSIAIDSLFAFDNLIKNADRGQGRPNILLQDEKAYLIDHELAFNIDGGTFNDIVTKNWGFNLYKRHIFYEYLANSKNIIKQNYFFEFEEYLRYLNLNKLKTYLEQLKFYGYKTSDSEYVLEYLEIVKRNSSSFVKLLQGLITKV